ncbi:MAG: hypothetical protein ACUVTW_03380 [Thermogutta sp.]
MRLRYVGLGLGAALLVAVALGQRAVAEDAAAGAPQKSPLSAASGDWLAQRAEWHAVMSEWLAERAKPNADPARLAELQTRLQSMRPIPGTAPAWQPGVCPWGGPGRSVGPAFGRGPVGPGQMAPGYGRGRGMGYGPVAGGFGPSRGFGLGFGPGPRRTW